MEQTLTTTHLKESIPLGCDYWYTEQTKCGEDANIRLEQAQTGVTLLSCDAHHQALARSLRKESR